MAAICPTVLYLVLMATNNLNDDHDYDYDDDDDKTKRRATDMSTKNLADDQEGN